MKACYYLQNLILQSCCVLRRLHTGAGEAKHLRHSNKTSCGWCGASKRERPTGHEAIRLSLWQRRLLCTNDSINPTQTSPSSPRGRPKNSPCLPTTSPTAFTSRASTSATSAARFVRTEFAYCGYRSDEDGRGTPTPELLC